MKSLVKAHWIGWLTAGLAGLLGVLILLAIGCDIAERAVKAEAVVQPSASAFQRISLGDIEPDEPTKKVKRFTPLAQYLADNLHEHGILEGEVVIARDFEEMARFLTEGIVDVYFDSAFPTMNVQQLADTEIVLRRWKDEAPAYWSVYIARQDAGINGVEDFIGKVLAFEKPHSTSGFVLPGGTLVQRGFTLKQVSSADEAIPPHEIGYLFSRDEENSIEMVLQGVVAGAGLSNQDYEELPDEIKGELVVFDRTIEVPRQLVSVRPGLQRELVDEIVGLLTGLNETDEGRQVLEALKKTTKFDALPADAHQSLGELKHLIDLLIP